MTINCLPLQGLSREQHPESGFSAPQWQKVGLKENQNHQCTHLIDFISLGSDVIFCYFKQDTTSLETTEMTKNQKEIHKE